MLSSESPNSLPEKTSPCHNESGFTLLEIIAVIVILSILAVVAVPKYFDLQEQARLKTLKTAVAEGVGRVNGCGAKRQEVDAGFGYGREPAAGVLACFEHRRVEILDGPDLHLHGRPPPSV